MAEEAALHDCSRDTTGVREWKQNSGDVTCTRGTRNGRAGVGKYAPAAFVVEIKGGGERCSFLKINFVPGWSYGSPGQN